MDFPKLAASFYRTAQKYTEDQQDYGSVRNACSILEKHGVSGHADFKAAAERMKPTEAGFAELAWWWLQDASYGHAYVKGVAKKAEHKINKVGATWSDVQDFVKTQLVLIVSHVKQGTLVEAQEVLDGLDSYRRLSNFTVLVDEAEAVIKSQGIPESTLVPSEQTL